VGYGYADAWMIDSRRSGLPRTITQLLRGGAPQMLFFDVCPTFRAAIHDTVVTHHKTRCANVPIASWSTPNIY